MVHVWSGRFVWAFCLILCIERSLCYSFSVCNQPTVQRGNFLRLRRGTALQMQLFPIEGMGFSLKWPGKNKDDTLQYHEQREQHHLARIKYHEERARYHREEARSKAGASSSGGQVVVPTNKLKTRILFVDLSNTCRSAAAEGMFNVVATKAGKEDLFDVGSCSTGGGTPEWFKPEVAKYIERDLVDPRMTSHAIKRGITLSGIRSRPMTSADVKAYDIIVCMDEQNKRDILTAAEYWGLKEEAKRKLRFLTSYCRGTTTTEVPDPYYGGKQGFSGQVFERVLDLLNDGCHGLLADVEQGLA